jgi:hypothetical protein
VQLPHNANCQDIIQVQLISLSKAFPSHIS